MHDVIIINNESHEIHTAKRMTGSCNLSKPGNYNRDFFILGCNNDREIEEKLRSARASGYGNYCLHCFTKSEQERLLNS